MLVAAAIRHAATTAGTGEAVLAAAAEMGINETAALQLAAFATNQLEPARREATTRVMVIPHRRGCDRLDRAHPPQAPVPGTASWPR